MENSKDDVKTPLGPGATPDPVLPQAPIQRWREALSEMPEWPSLPDDIQNAVLCKLRNTKFPTEPSGHASWKHVKAKLAHGEQPDWVQLIAATFVWRVKQKRPETVYDTSLPDTFVAAASFAIPPVDIQNWPTKACAAAAAKAEWEPKAEPINQNDENVIPQDVKPGSQPADYSPPQQAVKSGATEVSVPHQPFAPPARLSAPNASTVLTPTNGNAGQKRTRPSEDSNTNPRPVKRQQSVHLYQTTQSAARQPEYKQEPNINIFSDAQQRPPNPSQYQPPEPTLSDLSRQLTYLTQLQSATARDLAETKQDLAETKQRLAQTTQRAEDAAAELAELRAVAQTNRRCIRRLVGDMANRARARESAAGLEARGLLLLGRRFER